jgi:sugar lactone lactonase YvrE
MAGGSAQGCSRRQALAAGLAGLLALAARPTVGAEPPPRPPRFLLAWGRRGKEPGAFFGGPIAIALDPAGNVYTTEFRNDRVQKWTPDGQLLEVFAVGMRPGGIAVDGQGRLFLAHFGHESHADRIAVHGPDGRLLRQWGRTGSGDGELRNPGGLCFGPDGTLYVADQVNRRVLRYTPEGKLVGKWGEYGTGPGQFGGSDKRESATAGPNMIAVDRDGHVYTTEASEARVQKFTLDGKHVLHWGQAGSGPRTTAELIGICVDRQDRIWVCGRNHRVQQFTATGAFLQEMGARGSEPGRFGTPHGMVVDRQGHLYVCDTGNARVQKFAL